MQLSDINLGAMTPVAYPSKQVQRIVDSGKPAPRLIYHDGARYYKIWRPDYPDYRSVFWSGKRFKIDIRDSNGAEILPGFLYGLFDETLCPAFVDYIYDGASLVGYITAGGRVLSEFEEANAKHTGFVDHLIENSLNSGFVYRDLKMRNMIELPDGRLSLIDLEPPLTALNGFSVEHESKSGSLARFTLVRYRRFIKAYLNPDTSRKRILKARAVHAAGPPHLVRRTAAGAVKDSSAEQRHLIIRLPRNKEMISELGGARRYINMMNSSATAMQRKLRRDGLANYTPYTQAAVLTSLQCVRRGRVFYDVGSHIGLYSLMVSGIFYRSGVGCYAFEATPETAKMARELRDINNMTYYVRQAAVSSEARDVELYISPKAETSNSLNASFRPGSTAINVRAITLDSFLDGGAPPPSVIKIDVATHEPQVILGARNVIERARPTIICEILPRANKAALRDCLEYLASIHYRFYNLGDSGPLQESSMADVLGNGSTTLARDWLISPQALDDAFHARFKVWCDAISECTVATNQIVEPGANTIDWLEDWLPDGKR